MENLIDPMFTGTSVMPTPPTTIISVLFFTLEFVDPMFSGNGVHSRTIVESLLRGGCRNVHVVSGCDQSFQSESSQNPFHSNTFFQAALTDGRLHLTILPLSTWGHVSRQGPWQEFGDSIAARADKIITKFESLSCCDGGRSQNKTNKHVRCVFGVDWSSWRGAQACRNAWLTRMSDNDTPSLPMIHLNFRVYYEQPNESNDGSDNSSFYFEEEKHACERADVVIALTASDLKALEAVIPDTCKRRYYLPPPIRSDVETAARELLFESVESWSKETERSDGGGGGGNGGGNGNGGVNSGRSSGGVNSGSSSRSPLPPPPQKAIVRKFITCCARITEEKNVLEGFISLMEMIGAKRMKHHGLIPMLFGRKTSPKYSNICVTRLKAAFPEQGACEVKEKNL